LFVGVGTRKNMNHHITWMRGRALRVCKEDLLGERRSYQPLQERYPTGEELENLWPFELK
jgi:hypothetical protein